MDGRRALLMAALLVAGTLFTCPAAFADLRVAAGGQERTVDANCDIQPNAAGDPFFQQVQDCLDELEVAGKDGLIKQLVASPRTHIVARTTGGSSAEADGVGGFRDAAGDAGAGAGSTVRWNPTNSHLPNGYPDGSPRDPCGALLHELVHSGDMDRGLMSKAAMDTNDDLFAGRVFVDEVRACQMQNWLHQHKGLSSRAKYAGQPLPAGVRFDLCPDCVTLLFSGAPPVDVADAYYEIPVQNAGPANPPHEVPGRSVEVRDGSGVLLGHVALVKQLDGRLTLALECEPGQSVVLVGLQFKNDGQPLGPTVSLPSPIVCDAMNPTASGDVDVPPVPALRILKSPDDQRVPTSSTIQWTIVVENIGKVPLSNVSVIDTPLTGCSFTIPTLAPGAKETRTCSGTTGTSTGSSTNTVEAQAMTPGGSTVGPVRDASPFEVVP